jgi:hypothetical protein
MGAINFYRDFYVRFAVQAFLGAPLTLTLSQRERGRKTYSRKESWGEGEGQRKYS